MAVGGKAGPVFRVFLKGCPRGSSGGISRLLIVISMCDWTLLGLQVVVYDAQTSVVVNGCVRMLLEVTDPWTSCGGGCLCIHT